MQEEVKIETFFFFLFFFFVETRRIDRDRGNTVPAAAIFISLVTYGAVGRVVEKNVLLRIHACRSV